MYLFVHFGYNFITEDVEVCPEINEAEYESIDTGDRSLGTTLVIKCGEDHSVPGAPAVCSQKLKTDNSGFWDGAIGCLPNCPAANELWGKSFGVPNNGFGAQLKVECADGYENSDRMAMPTCVYDSDGDFLKWQRDVVCKRLSF